MRCIVKKTLDTIVSSNNHYVVAIKRNSKTLFNLIESATAKLATNVGYYKKVEMNRGRKETRIVHVFDVTEEITNYSSHIKSLIRVRRIRQRKMVRSEELVFYICDEKHTAKRFYEGIRGHWCIENRLHWVKDVVMNEDKSKITNIFLAPIMSILKSCIIDLAYSNCNSVINFQRTIAHNVEYMRSILE